MRRSLRIFFTIHIILAIFPLFCFAQTIRSANTEVELIPQLVYVKSQESFYVSLRMTMDNQWHTYWKNPGDAGYTTHIEWSLPEGFKAGEIIWPVPKRLELPPIMTYGYEKEVYLLSRLQAPQNIEKKDYTISAKVQWLACRIECVPGTADLSFIVTGADFSRENESFRALYPKIEAMLPQERLSENIYFSEDEEAFHLFIKKENFRKEVADIYFFPENPYLIQHSHKQNYLLKNGFFNLYLKKSSLYKKGMTESLDGLLFVQPAGNIQGAYYQISALREEIGGQGRLQAFGGDAGLSIAVVFAFLGGIILNLMPCVLPVLSIKIISLVDHRNKEDVAPIFHGIVFALGVLISFWILAGILIVLKSLGQQVGWGFQFQSPVFVICMAMLFLILALNLFGVFEIGLAFTRLQGFLPDKKSLQSSFLNGVLATVVATPCTAPFMGSALSYALVKPPIYSFIIFTSLGLGMAFPYFLFTAIPSLLRFIPKPGPWMLVLKRFFGCLFLLTVFWLGWVLSIQKGMAAAYYLAGGLLTTSIGCFMLGFRMTGKKVFYRRLGFISTVIAGLAISIIGVASLPSRSIEVKKSSEGIYWRNFDLHDVDESIKKGEAVFIDFTASWCLTCKVNEKIALENKGVVDAFRKHNIVSYKADWTNENSVITQALASYGKQSIPVYVLYYPGDPHPVILPEILTPSIVLSYLDKIDLQQ